VGPKEPPRPDSQPEDRAIHTFVRGKRSPRGIAWYGIGSFWGHLQHFIASGIATEDIDSRDWMHADDPFALARDLALHLTTGNIQQGETVSEMLGRDLIVDFVSDTGDDSDISEAVARLIFTPWTLPDPDSDGELVVPRGDVLFFGGDTAYPVATANEINDRMVVPFNRVLASVRNDDPPGTRRALLGIPGNHDWYDGLDGFGRLFRRRIGELSVEQEEPNLMPERESRFEHVVQFVEKFVVGGQIQKQKVLVLDGYVPVQQASYFALPLAPGIDMFAVDRQLRHVDFRQRKYFANFRSGRERNRLMVMLPDPVYSFQEESVTGVQMARSLELDLKHTPHIVLAGDIHHYERLTVDASLHVTAGGGGAFLHPARLGGEKLPVPVKQFPGVVASRALLKHVPWHVGVGRAGFVPHVVMIALFAPALEIGVRFRHQFIAALIAGVLGAVVLMLIGGVRYRPRPKAIRVAMLATIAGAVMGNVPPFVSFTFRRALLFMGVHTTPRMGMLLTLLIAVFTGAFVFGWYLAALTALGLESTQAFTCLGHPGFKHFVRLRVRKDGSAVDGWVIGLIDPLRQGEKPVLVDRWTWRPRG
jgi:hypothetical protein